MRKPRVIFVDHDTRVVDYATEAFHDVAEFVPFEGRMEEMRHFKADALAIPTRNYYAVLNNGEGSVARKSVYVPLVDHGAVEDPGKAFLALLESAEANGFTLVLCPRLTKVDEPTYLRDSVRIMREVWDDYYGGNI